ncbi:MAG: NUDIX hydrolase [Gammaproteobacteria bacterium]|nr:NUDIX hydrolase [Gammaproteobacteria bacterium]
MTEKDKTVFHGKIIEVGVQTTTLPNGQVMELEIVRHPGGAAVVAIDDQNRVCLLKQFRVVVNDWLWELPAGKIENKEPPLQTAQRELQEEAGVMASDWKELGKEISSPGIFNEIVYLYLAQGLHHGQQNKEDHEVLEVHWIDFNEVISMIYDGIIQDSKTIVGLVLAKQILDTGR